MLAVRVRNAKAEGLKKFLKKNALLNSKYRVFSSNSFIYFPLSSQLDDRLKKKAKAFGAEIINCKFKRQDTPRNEGKLQGYDLYGSIAVIECEPGEASALSHKLMNANKNIKTVLRKGGAVSGKYRTRKFFYVTGTKNYIAEYRENNCIFRFDIRKVFFSTRLSFERKRICNLVKNGEKVIVLFAGVGPYAIEIAKTHKKSKLIAIELNSAACSYMHENIKLNKTDNVIVEHGDALDFAKKYAVFADRIILPLPKRALEFIPAALKMGKNRCTVHYYTFCKSDGVQEEINRISEAFARNNKKMKLISYRVVRSYSAYEVEIVLDVLAH